MVSGVGPAEALKKLDMILAETSDPAKAMPNLFEYFTKARGPLAHSGTDFVAWEKLPRKFLS